MPFDVNFWPLYDCSHRGKETPTDETHVVSMCRQVQTNWDFRWLLQPFNKPVVASLSVPSDFLVGRSS